MLNNTNTLFIAGKEVKDAFINGKQFYPPTFNLTYVYNNTEFHVDMTGLTYNGSALTTATKSVVVGEAFAAGEISTGITYSLAAGWFAAGDHPVHVVGWYSDALCTTQITEGTVLDGSVKTVYAKFKADYTEYDWSAPGDTVGNRRAERSSVMSATTFLLPTILNAIKVYIIGGGGACGQAQNARLSSSWEGVEVAMTQPGSYGGSDISEYTTIGEGNRYAINVALGAGGQGGVVSGGSSYTINLGGTQTSKSVSGGLNGGSNELHINCGGTDSEEDKIARGYDSPARCVYSYGDTNPDVTNYSRRYSPKGSYPYNRFWMGRGSSYSSGDRSGYYVKLSGTRTELHPWSTTPRTVTVTLQVSAATYRYYDSDYTVYRYSSVNTSSTKGNLSFGQSLGYGYAGIGGLAWSTTTSGYQTYPYVNGQPGGCRIGWY